MKENKQPDTVSVRIDIGTHEILRQVKIHTGIPIASFITKAVFKEASKLPKAVKEKMAQNS